MQFIHYVVLNIETDLAKAWGCGLRVGLCRVGLGAMGRA